MLEAEPEDAVAAGDSSLITLWKNPDDGRVLKFGTGDQKKGCIKVLSEEASGGVSKIVMSLKTRQVKLQVLCFLSTSPKTEGAAKPEKGLDGKFSNNGARASGTLQDIESTEWALCSIYMPVNEVEESDWQWRFLFEVNAKCNEDLLTSRCLEEVPRSPRKSQKEDQESQWTLKQLEGSPLDLLSLPGSPGLPSGSSLGPTFRDEGIPFFGLHTFVSQ